MSILAHPAFARVRALIGKILRSKWTWLGLALFFSFVTVVLYLETSSLLEIAKAKVQKRAEAGLAGREVRLGKFSTNFVNALSVDGVEVSNDGGFSKGSFLKIDQVRVRIRLKDLFRLVRLRDQLARNPGEWSSGNETFALIELFRPSAALARKNGRWDIPVYASDPGRKKPSLRIQVKDGELRVSDDSGRLDGLSADKISGWAELVDGTVRFDASAEGPEGARVKAQGAPKDAQTLKIALKGQKLPAAEILRRTAVLPSSTSLSGAFDLEGSAEIPLSTGSAHAGIGQARISAASLQFSVPQKSAELSAEARIRWTPAEIEIESAVLKSTGSEIQLSGKTSPWAKVPRVEAKLGGLLDLGEWAALLPRKLRVQGRSRVDLSCSGDLKSPQWAGTIRTESASVNGLEAALDASVGYAEKTLSIRPLSASIGSAKISLEGTFSEESSDWTLKSEDFGLDSFASDPAAVRLSGRISGKLRGTGPSGSPKLSGNLSVKDFSWGNIRLPRVYGRIETRNRLYRAALSGTNPGDRLVLEVEDKHPAWEIRQLSVNLADGQSAKASGRFQQDTGKIQATVSAAAVSLQTIQPFVHFLSHFEGRSSLQGKLEGTVSDPVFSSKIYAKNLALSNPALPDRGIGNFSSSLAADRSGVRLNNLKIGDSYRISYEYRRAPQKAFSVQGSVTRGDPRILFAVLNLETSPTGRMNGEFKISKLLPELGAYPVSPWSGEGRLEIADGNWAAVPFRTVRAAFRAQKSKIEVQEFSIVQDSGSLTARASADETQAQNPLTLTASLQDFAAGDNRINGNAVLSGSIGLGERSFIEGAVKSDDFKFNGFSAGGALKGKLSIENKALALQNLEWGDFFKGQLRLIFGGPKTLMEGQWFSKTKDLKEWSRLSRTTNLPLAGSLALSGSVKGPVERPEFSLSAECTDLRLANRAPREGAEDIPGLSGKGTALFSDRLLKSLSLKLSDPNGGQVTVLGQANLKSKELSLETSFNAIEVQNLLEGLGLTALKGKSSGTLSLRGPWTNPETQGRIQGKDGQIGNIPLDGWEIAGKFAEKEILFTRMDLFGRKGSWKLSLLEDSWIRPLEGQKTGSFRLATEFKNIALGPVHFVGDGVAEGSWKPDEKTQQVAVETRFKVKQCFVNGYEISQTDLRLRYQNKILELLGLNQSGRDKAAQPLGISGSADFSSLPCVVVKKLRIVEGPENRFYLNGHLCPEQPDFQMDGNGVNAALLGGILESPLDISGPAVFHLVGAVRDREPVFEGSLSLKNGKIEQVPMDSLDTKFRWEDGMLTVSPLKARSREYFSVNASGSFPLALGNHPAKNPKVDYSLRISEGNLAFLNSLDLESVKDAAGSVSGSLSVKGTPGSAKVDGFLEIGKGQLRTKYLSRKAEEINLRIQIKSNKVSIQEAEAVIGGGKIRAAGTLHCDLGTDGLVFDRYDFILETIGKKGVPVQVPELPLAKEKLGLLSAPSKGVPTFQLKAAGSGSRPKISGWIELEDAYFSWPPAQRKGGDSSDWAEWDIELRTGQRAYFQNDMVNAHVSGKIRLLTVQDQLTASGRVTSDEGSITIYGSNFAIREAALDLEPPQAFSLKLSSTSSSAHTAVYLQFKAEQTRKVENDLTDTITLQLDRTPLTEKFDPKKLRFISAQNPDLVSEKVAGRAGLGIQLEGLPPEERDAQLRDGMARLVDSQIATPLARAIAARTGVVDNIQFTRGEETGRTKATRGDVPTAIDPFIGYSFIFEKSLGSRTSVGYKATIDKVQDRPDLVHQLQVQYMLLKGLYVYGTRELDSKENLGHNPESVGGVRYRIKFDPRDWFSGAPDPAPKKNSKTRP